MDCPDNLAGTKFTCPNCGQRLLVPQPPVNRTMLGTLDSFEPGASGGPAPAPSGASFYGPGVEVRVQQGVNYIYWNCPLCHKQLYVPADSGEQTVLCPHCARNIAIPQKQSNPQAPPPPNNIVPSVLEVPQPRPPIVRGPEEDPFPRRGRRSLDLDVDRQYGGARSFRVDDDEFRRRRPIVPQDYSGTALAALLCGLGGLALVLVSIFVFVAMVSRTSGPRDAEPAFILLSLIMLGSFVLSILGIVLGGRSMNPANVDHRGSAIAGLTCGIIGLVISVLFGLFWFCALMTWWSAPSRW
jgi:hypothetical protein